MDDKFIRHIEEILELDINSMTWDSEYKDQDEWDSLAELSVITMIQDQYNKTVEASIFSGTSTIKELYKKVFPQ